MDWPLPPQYKMRPMYWSSNRGLSVDSLFGGIDGT